jgi:DNA-binding MarR family transcriptional regulator
MGVILFSGDDMNRVVGYRLLALLAVLGVVVTAYNSAILIDYFTPEDEQPVNEEDNFSAEMTAADDSGDEDDSGAAPESADSRNDEPVAGDEADGMATVGFTAIMAALLLALVTVGLVGSLGVGVLISEGVKTGLVLALAGPLLAKLHGKEKDVQTRGRIEGYVEAHPGIHFSALRDALTLANGVTAHHLHQLEKAGELISWQDGRRRRYAVSGTDPKKLYELESPVTGMQRAILEVLSGAGDLGISTVEIRTKLEASKQLMAYHLKQLQERELIDKEGKGRKATWQLSVLGYGQLSVVRESGLS